MEVENTRLEVGAAWTGAVTAARLQIYQGSRGAPPGLLASWVTAFRLNITTIISFQTQHNYNNQLSDST